MGKTFWDHIQSNIPNAPSVMHKAMWEYLLTLRDVAPKQADPSFEAWMNAAAEGFKAGWIAKGTS